jgi:hypothetical protein
MASMSGSESLATTAVAVTITDGRPDGTASDVTVTRCDRGGGTGLVRRGWLGASAGRVGSHGPGGQIASSEPPTPPYTDRALGLLMPIAHNQIRFFGIAIRFRQNRPDIPGPGNGPFLLKRRVSGRKFVIAVTDGGLLRCLCDPYSLARH